MCKKSILWKADGFHSDVRNIEPQGFYDPILSYSKYVHPGLWNFRLWFDMQLPSMAVHEFALLHVWSMIFFTILGGPTKSSRYFRLWLCINNEIVYKRPLVTPLVLGTVAKSRLMLRSIIIYYRSTGYRSRQVVAQRTKGKRWNTQKYMNRIVCLAKLSLH